MSEIIQYSAPDRPVPLGGSDGRPLIEFKHVDKAYDKGPNVITDLNLTIKEGSFTVLLGPSGCGKSTTLRMIAGLETLTNGVMTIDGVDMKDAAPGERGIAMVFQNYALYPTMTVKGNIEFGMKNDKVPKNVREQFIKEVAEKTGLTEYLNRKPSALSGGQRQRVALARAMVKKPKIFLMDEPLSNLDAKLRAALRSDLIQLHRDLGSTFVYVTHDQTEAMSMGSDIVLMQDGFIMQEGSPEEIYYDPANVFTARFIGTPPMNILDAAPMRDLIRMPEGTAWIGFRPEHTEFEDTGEDCLVLDATVTTREMLGSEAQYKLSSPYGEIIVKEHDTRKRREGNVQLHFSSLVLYFFDKDENRIQEK